MAAWENDVKGSARKITHRRKKGKFTEQQKSIMEKCFDKGEQDKKNRSDYVSIIVSVKRTEISGSITAKELKAEGASAGEIQKQGSLAYQSLLPDSKEKYIQLAASSNDPSAQSSEISKEKKIKRVIKNIDANIKQLDDLGCPSIWLGYGARVPQRLFSPQMSELAEDGLFTNYVVSDMIKKW
ncbi:Hypothetical predicted protein [Paramuricea clavata]|uniref:Uncharacterized protein n=1 Tax=Paramuricea clavata TaxID=317549 RepID=A0A7D9I2Z6_PARCT|nr:Hypothetical predicted protein [Paramuricea clavata]